MDILPDYYEVKTNGHTYRIEMIYCETTYPCTHSVTIDGKKKRRMNATEIKKLYVDAGLEIPHHFTYKNPRLDD